MVYKNSYYRDPDRNVVGYKEINLNKIMIQVHSMTRVSTASY